MAEVALFTLSSNCNNQANRPCHGWEATSRKSVCGRRFDVNPSAFAIEFDDAVNQREQRVVVALPDVAARMVAIAYLPNQDIASPDRFTTVFFDSTSLRVRVATVSAGSLSLFMGHGETSQLPSTRITNPYFYR
jgi:hypothetical protein